MTLEEVLQQVESTEVSVTLNVASSYWPFIREARKLEAVHSLMTLLRTDASLAARVLDRIRLLCNKEVDPRYEHPDDTAIAIYLDALATIGSDVLGEAAQLVQDTHELWWAKRILLERK